MKHSRPDVYDVIVIGGGPAGMAAAYTASEKARVALIEREARIGGILKQCIHDGFGVTRFKERLTGPEYAWRCAQLLAGKKNIDCFVLTFVTHIERGDDGLFTLRFTNPERGVFTLRSRALVAATGCRERSDRQVFIHGDRPAGIFTAGQAQAFINMHGYLPGKRCVILGSGDIGLIMARRLTLEGAAVTGVYEIKPAPSGLSRNIAQCLDDYGIPLHLSTTVSEVHGRERVEGVTVMRVDEMLRPVAGTERRISCDTLILSVGLIPENDILLPLSVPMDGRTKGPVADQYMQTQCAGIFSCGNALHVNDLADYVSESGDTAGKYAALYAHGGGTKRNAARRFELCGPLLYVVPQCIAQPADDDDDIIVYFRAARELGASLLCIRAGDNVIAEKHYESVKPPEMERLCIPAGLFREHEGALVCELSETAACHTKER